jgi:hypothetical protein
VQQQSKLIRPEAMAREPVRLEVELEFLDAILRIALYLSNGHGTRPERLRRHHEPVDEQCGRAHQG